MNIFYKTLAGLTLTICTSTAFGQNWNKIYQCNDGAMVIDRAEVSAPHGSGTYNIYQVVIRDQGVVQYFKSQGFDYMANGNQIIANWLRKSGDVEFSFQSDFGTPSKYLVKGEGEGMRVKFEKAVLGGFITANWYFESCDYVN